jgi:preprotein translocase subunit SecE
MNAKKTVMIALGVVSVFVYIIATHVYGLIFDALRWAVTRDYFLTIPEILALVTAVLIYFFVYRNQKTFGFFTEAVIELQKVTYPTKKEAGQSAGIVLILVAIAAVILALYDVVWSLFTKFILG